MRGHLQFLVKWEGYGYEENSWVSEQDVMAPDKLHKFYWIHPGAPHQICLMAFQSLMSHASRTQHARRGMMSGDTPPHTSTVPDSTPLFWNPVKTLVLRYNTSISTCTVNEDRGL